jgi:hypothetical protein
MVHCEEDKEKGIEMAAAPRELCAVCCVMCFQTVDCGAQRGHACKGIQTHESRTLLVDPHCEAINTASSLSSLLRVVCIYKYGWMHQTYIFLNRIKPVSNSYSIVAGQLTNSFTQ